MVVGTGAGIADGTLSALTTVASDPASVVAAMPNAGSAGVTEGTGGGSVDPDGLRGIGGGIVELPLR